KSPNIRIAGVKPLLLSSWTRPVPTTTPSKATTKQEQGTLAVCILSIPFQARWPLNDASADLSFAFGVGGYQLHDTTAICTGKNCCSGCPNRSRRNPSSRGFAAIEAAADRRSTERKGSCRGGRGPWQD